MSFFKFMTQTEQLNFQGIAMTIRRCFSLYFTYCLYLYDDACVVRSPRFLLQVPNTVYAHRKNSTRASERCFSTVKHVASMTQRYSAIVSSTTSILNCTFYAQTLWWIEPHPGRARWSFCRCHIDLHEVSTKKLQISICEGSMMAMF